MSDLEPVLSHSNVCFPCVVARRTNLPLCITTMFSKDTNACHYSLNALRLSRCALTKCSIPCISAGFSSIPRLIITNKSTVASKSFTN